MLDDDGIGLEVNQFESIINDDDVLDNMEFQSRETKKNNNKRQGLCLSL